jgi:hypothetical protein
VFAVRVDLADKGALASIGAVTQAAVGTVVIRLAEASAGDRIGETHLVLLTRACPRALEGPVGVQPDLRDATEQPASAVLLF